MARSDAVSSHQASEQGRPPEHTSKFYAKGALQYLVPILTQTLTKQVAPGHQGEPLPLSTVEQPFSTGGSPEQTDVGPTN